MCSFEIFRIVVVYVNSNKWVNSLSCDLEMPGSAVILVPLNAIHCSHSCLKASQIEIIIPEPNYSPMSLTS